MKQKPRKPRKPFYAATRVGKAGITLHLDRAIHKDLKHLALDLNLTLEGLTRQAVLSVLKQHGRPTAHLERADRQAG